jgi:putative transcriptional regulator
VPADSEIIFDTEHESKWERAIAKLGIDPRMLSDTAGHA